jgi:hypothetical protein
VRYAAPLALLLLTAFPEKGNARRVEWLLRWGVAGTFVGHGLSALWLKPFFVDLIIGTMNLFLGDPIFTAVSFQDLEEALSIAASRQAHCGISFADYCHSGLHSCRSPPFAWKKNQDYCLMDGSLGICNRCEPNDDLWMGSLA